MSINPINGYDRIAKFIASKPMQKIIKYADKNPAIFQSATVFGMCSVMRPATILITPAKTEEEKKDRLYSSAKSVASGITDLAFSTLLFMPLNKIINNTTEKLFKDNNSILFNNQKAIKMYKNLMNRGLKFLTIPIIAYLNFRYVKDIAQIMTGNFKGNKDENKQNIGTYSKIC